MCFWLKLRLKFGLLSNPVRLECQIIGSFDLPFLWKYVVGKSFDFYRYASDLKSGALLAPKGVRPLFGNFYLPHNFDILTRRIRSRRTDVRRKNLLTDVGWLSPEHEFWGRGDVEASD